MHALKRKFKAKEKLKKKELHNIRISDYKKKKLGDWRLYVRFDTNRLSFARYDS